MEIEKSFFLASQYFFNRYQCWLPWQNIYRNGWCSLEHLKNIRTTNSMEVFCQARGVLILHLAELVFTFRACFLDTKWVSTAASRVSTSFALAMMVSIGSSFFFLTGEILLGFRSDIEANAWAIIGDFC